MPLSSELKGVLFGFILTTVGYFIKDYKEWSPPFLEINGICYDKKDGEEIILPEHVSRAILNSTFPLKTNHWDLPSIVEATSTYYKIINNKDVILDNIAKLNKASKYNDKFVYMFKLLNNDVFHELFLTHILADKKSFENTDTLNEPNPAVILDKNIRIIYDKDIVHFGESYIKSIPRTIKALTPFTLALKHNNWIEIHKSLKSFVELFEEDYLHAQNSFKDLNEIIRNKSRISVICYHTNNSSNTHTVVKNCRFEICRGFLRKPIVLHCFSSKDLGDGQKKEFKSSSTIHSGKDIDFTMTTENIFENFPQKDEIAKYIHAKNAKCRAVINIHQAGFRKKIVCKSAKHIFDVDIDYHNDLIEALKRK